MPTMKNMGPACCCCNNIYVGMVETASNAQRRYETKGNQPGNPALGWSPQQFSYGRSLDFDPVHKRLFVVRGQMPAEEFDVFRYNEDFTNQTLLTTLGSDAPKCITSDSDNELVYFTSTDFPVTTATLHVMAHDGTGYAAVGGLTNSGGQARIPIHYCRTNGKLYYCSSATGQKLYRINTDGTGDTLLATGAGTNSNITDVTVDNDNSRIFWVDNSSFTGDPSRIYTSDLDGTGVALVYSGGGINGATGPLEFFRGPQWSHKHERLYVWFEDQFISISADTTHGLISMEANGTDVRLHIARGNGSDWWAFGGATPQDWRLACGFETLGAGSTA